jgi:superfamily I DNA and/or RNA helicase
MLGREADLVVLSTVMDPTSPRDPTLMTWQGREADLVVLSTVRAVGGTGLGFVADARRANVALSRAREAMIVVGCAEALRVERIWHVA